ncbi:hypothetical protein KS4_15160 [Poriferisphaera corsica]|uniref:Uncharacterized protein n=1 Tax=Poriferisphaera corsica TaxID=2528020 RepID=A0A517YTB8_9BACT|nr:hypothetical protein KS4_15160 [Poriferisphaera corsica]
MGSKLVLVGGLCRFVGYLSGLEGGERKYRLGELNAKREWMVKKWARTPKRAVSGILLRL